MKTFYKGAVVAVTGAAGTVGSEVVRQLRDHDAGEIRLIDNNESELFLQMESAGDSVLRCYLGDIRDRGRMAELFSGVDVVIHAAAFKHVILSEYNPFDVIQTNVLGVDNVIRAARSSGVKLVLFTSSDKAVNPTNVMGTSKLMGEKLMAAANTQAGSPTTCSCVRFGNVLGSRGSVVPMFVEQIKNGGPVTLTDRRMTRFVMTVGEAARLVLKAGTLCRGGEVFVTKMPVISIPDLAHVMIEILAPACGYDPSRIAVEEVGARPGEKMYEELVSGEEVGRGLELQDMFVITPALKALYGGVKYDYSGIVTDRLERSYVSDSEGALSREELKTYLRSNDILSKVEQHFAAGR